MPGTYRTLPRVHNLLPKQHHKQSYRNFIPLNSHFYPRGSYERDRSNGGQRCNTCTSTQTVYEMGTAILIKKIIKSRQVNTWYTTRQPTSQHLSPHDESSGSHELAT